MDGKANAGAVQVDEVVTGEGAEEDAWSGTNMVAALLFVARPEVCGIFNRPWKRQRMLKTRRG